MSTRNVLLDQSINSDASATSSVVTISNDATVTFQFEGDDDSNDLDLRVEARVDPVDGWAELDDVNINLTDFSNNNYLKQYDVLDLEEFRITVTNNAAQSTNLKIISSHSEQQ